MATFVKDEDPERIIVRLFSLHNPVMREQQLDLKKVPG